MASENERQETITVPTELQRSDPVWDIVIGLAMVLVVIQCIKPHDMGGFGLPWYVLMPLLLPVAIWVMTGEGAADIPYLGSVAAGLRAKFGLRRAHEWVLAYKHYVEVRIWPDGKDQCVASWNSSRRRITRWHRQLSEATAWKLSRVRSWASAIRSSLSR